MSSLVRSETSCEVILPPNGECFLFVYIIHKDFTYVTSAHSSILWVVLGARCHQLTRRQDQDRPEGRLARRRLVTAGWRN